MFDTLRLSHDEFSQVTWILLTVIGICMTIGLVWFTSLRQRAARYEDPLGGQTQKRWTEFRERV